MAWTNSKPLKSLLTMCALRVLGKKLSDRPSNRNMCTNVFFVQYTPVEEKRQITRAGTAGCCLNPTVFCKKKRYRI